MSDDSKASTVVGAVVGTICGAIGWYIAFPVTIGLIDIVLQSVGKNPTFMTKNFIVVWSCLSIIGGAITGYTVGKELKGVTGGLKAGLICVVISALFTAVRALGGAMIPTP